MGSNLSGETWGNSDLLASVVWMRRETEITVSEIAPEGNFS